MSANDFTDPFFSLRLEQWARLRAAYQGLFTPHELAVLDRAERLFNPAARTVVQLAFENRFVSLGGLAPVMKHLPRALTALGETVIVISPFHSGSRTMASAYTAGLFETCFADIPFSICDYQGSITVYRDTAAEMPVYFLEIKDRFVAGDNPYAYGDQNELVLDALAFSAAVPIALARLGIRDNLLFHAHEWETAPIAITSKMAVVNGLLGQSRTLLTLHNSFDAPLSGALHRTFFGVEPATQVHTVLQCTLPFLNGPLTTVSAPFARELKNDPLQRTVFVDHLQKQLAMNPPLGIENGLFGEKRAPFTRAALAEAAAGRFDAIVRRKNTLRGRFIKALGMTSDQRIIGKISFPAYARDTQVPVFFLAGRLDLMQKGFDVLFHAFSRLKRGEAKLFFCPSSMAGGQGDSLAFFRVTAERCAGDIEIWPFKIDRRVYDLFLRGASYLLMPSLYEPYGSANEGLQLGTPVVARGTGGLWVQVNSAVPVNVPDFYGSVLYDSPAKRARATGILYREAAVGPESSQTWRTLLEMPLEERVSLPLYESMIAAAHSGLKKAIWLYGQPEKYGPLCAHAVAESGKQSWEAAAIKYRQVYDVATGRGG